MDYVFDVSSFDKYTHTHTCNGDAKKPSGKLQSVTNHFCVSMKRKKIERQQWNVYISVFVWAYNSDLKLLYYISHCCDKTISYLLLSLAQCEMKSVLTVSKLVLCNHVWMASVYVCRAPFIN